SHCADDGISGGPAPRPADYRPAVCRRHGFCRSELKDHPGRMGHPAAWLRRSKLKSRPSRHPSPRDLRLTIYATAVLCTHATGIPAQSGAESIIISGRWLPMPLARIFTRNPEGTADLSGQLRQQGYTVEVARPDQTNLAPADLEIEFEVCERADVLHRAAN